MLAIRDVSKSKVSGISCDAPGPRASYAAYARYEARSRGLIEIRIAKLVRRSLPQEGGKIEGEEREVELHPRVRVWSPGLLSGPIPYCAVSSRPPRDIALSCALNIINLSVRTGRPKETRWSKDGGRSSPLTRRSISIYALVPRRYLLEIIIRAVVKSRTGPFLSWYLTLPRGAGALHVPLYKVSLSSARLPLRRRELFLCCETSAQ